MKKYIYFFLTCFLILSLSEAFCQSISGVINSYYAATGVNIAANSITLTDVTGLSTGDRVLIIQMKGASYDNSNTASYGNVTSIGNAGNYEFNTICSISGNDIILQQTLLNTYSAALTDKLQVIKVPQYTNPTVTSNLTCAPWNNSTGTGGVLVLEATGTLTLNDTITVKAMGFKGGAYFNFAAPTYSCGLTSYSGFVTTLPPSGDNHGAQKGEGIGEFTAAGTYARGKQINGGGGGNNHNSGGAGGSNYAAGGVGGIRTVSGLSCYGANAGVAGIALSAYGYSTGANRIFLGGGGGAGHGNNNQGTAGGDGGGIIIIRANAIDGNGFPIIADGRNFYPAPSYSEGTPGALSDAGGGGGGAGTIILDVTNVISATNASARGGNGSNASWGDNNCFGPGGGGGGGAIWISAATMYPLLSTNVSGGNNGVRGPSCTYPSCDGTSGGAAPGSNGAVLYNYVAPINTIDFCAATLPVTQNVLKGNYSNEAVALTWNNPEKYYTSFIIERSNDYHFMPIGQVHNSENLQFIDKEPYQGKNLYRLQMIDKDGKVRYSNIIEIYTQFVNLTSKVYPNPTQDNITIECYSQNEEPIQIQIFDMLGKTTQSTEIHTVQSGKNTWNIPTQDWIQGVYYLQIIQGKTKLIHKIVKL